VVWGLPALMLVAGAVTLEERRGAPDIAPLRALGDASYSVYLVHALAISIVARGLAAAGISSPALLFAGGMAAGLAIGLAVYALVERPAMALFRGGLAGKRRAAGAAARAQV
jgi:exopolysaccharide production protein ExoZ